MADPHVAMDADAGKEQNAAVQVGVELETYKPAGEISKGPVVLLGVVVDEERQGTTIE